MVRISLGSGGEDTWHRVCQQCGTEWISGDHDWNDRDERHTIHIGAIPNQPSCPACGSFSFRGRIATGAQIQEWKQRQSAPQAGALPPPAWAPDPSRQHELRYWDGAKWTEHVSDGGVQAVDPVPPAP
jgi:ribosomal protein L32